MALFFIIIWTDSTVVVLCNQPLINAKQFSSYWFTCSIPSFSLTSWTACCIVLNVEWSMLQLEFFTTFKAQHPSSQVEFTKFHSFWNHGLWRSCTSGTHVVAVITRNWGIYWMRWIRWGVMKLEYTLSACINAFQFAGEDVSKRVLSVAHLLQHFPGWLPSGHLFYVRKGWMNSGILKTTYLASAKTVVWPQCYKSAQVNSIVKKLLRGGALVKKQLGWTAKARIGRLSSSSTRRR